MKTVHKKEMVVTLQERENYYREQMLYAEAQMQKWEKESDGYELYKRIYIKNREVWCELHELLRAFGINTLRYRWDEVSE